MKRYFANSVVAISLILCAVSVALWARSYWTDDAMVYGLNQYFYWDIGSDRGRVAIGYGWYWSGYESLGPLGLSYTCGVCRKFPSQWYWWRFGGFEYNEFAWDTSSEMLFVPWWFIVCALGGAPARWLRRYWRERRKRTLPLCGVCDYDLRGSVGRCPECGSAFSEINGYLPGDPRAEHPDADGYG